jgi:hypothetical protein
MKPAISLYLTALYSQGVISYSHNYLRAAYNIHGPTKVDRFLKLYFKMTKGKDTELTKKWRNLR